MKLNINTDAAVVFANKLERVAQRQLSYAVRVALNNTAFDVKKNTMPKTANAKFVNRSKNFFKANSRVEVAKGNDINTLEAKVGFVSTGLRGGNNFAVKDLEQQESGGTIKGKSFIPTKKARTSQSSNKLVAAKNRLTGIKKIIDTRQLRAKNARQAFKYGAAKAGVGNAVLHKNTLFRIDYVAGKTIKAVPIYSYKQGRSVKVRGTNFMQIAASISAAKMEEHFIAAAQKVLKNL